MKGFKRFLAYYKPYKALVALDLICAAIASLGALAHPKLIEIITKQALVSERDIAIQIMIKVIVAFVILAAVEYACNFFITYIGHVTGAKIEFDMRDDLFKHFQKLSFSYYDNVKTGHLMSRITTDLFDITELAHHGPEDIIISIIRIIGSAVILLNVNVLLTLIIFSMLPIMFVFSLHYNRQMKKAFTRNRERIADINAQIENSLSGIRVVKSFANEDLEIEKFREGNSRFVDSKKDSYHCMAKFHSGLNFFTACIQILVAAVGGMFIINGILELSDLLTFLLYIGLIIDPVRRLINFTEQFQNGATGFTRFLEILDVDPDIADRENAIGLKDVKGRVCFDDVSFKYADDTENVLTSLNITAEPGAYIALVGSSGVGKTTICNLIPRFYDVVHGSIRLDGVDIRDIELKSLRDSIGIVQQEVHLFTGSVADNIRYGKTDATDEEIIAAAINANAHDFIMKLPDGYDTYVGQRGVKLSGGQKQRISIARIFLKNPPVLILDEATSALDNESERIVQESFEKLAKGRTTFVIAHRLSTIRNAERILVLTETGIAEDGSHQELMDRNGIYTRLYNMQFRETV